MKIASTKYHEASEEVGRRAPEPISENPKVLD